MAAPLAGAFARNVEGSERMGWAGPPAPAPGAVAAESPGQRFAVAALEIAGFDGESASRVERNAEVGSTTGGQSFVVKRTVFLLYAAWIAQAAQADLRLVEEGGCYLDLEGSGVAIYADRGIRGDPGRWVMRWVLDDSWGIAPAHRGARRVLPVELSDGARLTVPLRWDEAGRTMLLLPDTLTSFRTSQWVSFGAERYSLGDAEGAWRQLLACMGQSALPPQVAAASSGDWLRVEGYIDGGWARRQIHRIVEAMPVQGVVLSGQGGEVAEAISLARWLRGQGLATVVSGECASACVLAFAGGVERYLEPGARIGVHQFSALEGGSFAAGQRVTAEAAAFLAEMGIDETLALIAARVAARDMRWLTPDEVLAHRLATRKLDERLDL